MTVDEAYKHIRVIVQTTRDTPEAKTMIMSVLGKLADDNYGHGFNDGYKYTRYLFEEGDDALWQSRSAAGRLSLCAQRVLRVDHGRQGGHYRLRLLYHRCRQARSNKGASLRTGSFAVWYDTRMAETFAKRVAELILAESQSGSASWDELNGPNSLLTQVSENEYRITLPGEYENDGPVYWWGSKMCQITVKSYE